MQSVAPPRIDRPRAPALWQASREQDPPVRLPQAKLDQVLDRFHQVEARMGAATDGQEIVRLSKEHAEIPKADAHKGPEEFRKRVIKGLDGDFEVPTSAEAIEFVNDTIQAAVTEFLEQDIEGNELRSYAPGYGHGSTLDMTRPETFAKLICELDAWTFEGEIIELPQAQGLPPFVQEMRELMVSVHDDIYSEVGRLFDVGALTVIDGLVRIVDDPDDAPA